MAFLNPAILFGLLAVSIPILIHLFNLKRVQKVEFSTLMFIKELQKSKLRKIKILQLLLLLFRIFIIAFLVLCFAKPVYKGYAGDNSTIKTSVIFIDDSFSMNIKDGKGAYYEQARDAVKNILQTHRETDEVYLVPVSSIGMQDKKIFYESFGELIDSLNKMKTAFKPAAVNEMITFANELLKSSKNLQKEVYIISDLQKSNFTESISGISAAGSDLNENTALFIVNLGEREANNLSLENFKLKTKLLDKNRSVIVTIDAVNNSVYNVFNKTINIYTGNNKVGEKVVDIGSLSRTETELSFRPNTTGNINGYVEIVQSEFQDDELNEDNKFYFSIYIPEQFNVAIVEDSPQDSRFIKLALSTVEEVLADSGGTRGSFINLTTLNAIPENIKSYNAVFIAGKKSFSETESSMLKNYLTEGGGVFIFPSNGIDVNSYNNILLNKLNTARLNTIVPGNVDLKFERMDFEHPLLADIFLNEKLSITTENFRVESPNIRSFLDILPNENTSPLITLNNGKNFIIESKVGEGKLLLSAVSASTDLSDLPLKSLFAPIIIRSIYYMGNNYDHSKINVTGKANIISTRGLKNFSYLTTPGNIRVNLNEEGNNNAASGFFTFPYEPFSKAPGIYTITDSVDNRSFSFALNNNSSESRLEKQERSITEDHFTNAGYKNIKVVTNVDELKVRISEARFGLDLWKYFLILALLCIAAEIFISKKLEKG